MKKFDVYLYLMNEGSGCPRVGIHTLLSTDGRVFKTLGLESPLVEGQFEPLQAESLEDAQLQVRNLGGWCPTSPWYKALRLDDC